MIGSILVGSVVLGSLVIASFTILKGIKTCYKKEDAKGISDLLIREILSEVSGRTINLDLVGDASRELRNGECSVNEAVKYVLREKKKEKSV